MSVTEDTSQLDKSWLNLPAWWNIKETLVADEMSHRLKSSLNDAVAGFLVGWVTNWVALKDLKHSYPVELAEYAM